VTRASVLLGFLALLGADAGRNVEVSPPPAAPKKPEAKKRPPLAGRPYTIHVWAEAEPAARLDAKGKAELLGSWRGYVERFVGAPWEVTIRTDSGPFALGGLESLRAADLKALASEVDKLWMVRIAPNPAGGYRFAGREYDTTTGNLGPFCEVVAPYPADAARRLLRLSLILFRPFAEVGSAGAGDTSLTIQGSALTAADPIGEVAAVGSVFTPFRVFQRPNGAVIRLDMIRYSYLRVRSMDGSSARCDIISSLRDPLSKRVVGKNALIALGVKPSAVPTRFRFLTNAREAPEPVAGYTLTVRDVPDGPPREVGTTDRDGRIVVPPGMAENLVIFRLLAGNIEPLVEFPGMPGETGEERVIKVDPRSATVALETKLNALKDEVIDLVAVRARLEARLKARAEGEAWAEVKSLLDEYKKLPAKSGFVERVTALREAAMAAQQATKKAILTKTAQAQLADAEALVTRYLDDDMFQAYENAWKESQQVAATPAPKKGPANFGKPAVPPPSPPPVVAPAAPRPAAVAPANPASPPVRRPLPKPAAPPPTKPNVVPF
jgi:hypothetical protein